MSLSRNLCCSLSFTALFRKVRGRCAIWVAQFQSMSGGRTIWYPHGECWNDLHQLMLLKQIKTIMQKKNKSPQVGAINHSQMGGSLLNYYCLNHKEYALRQGVPPPSDGIFQRRVTKIAWCSLGSTTWIRPRHPQVIRLGHGTSHGRSRRLLRGSSHRGITG